MVRIQPTQPSILPPKSGRTSGFRIRGESVCAQHNLGVAFTSFVGRDAFVDVLAEALFDKPQQPIAVVGPAGCGKTRAVLEVLRRDTAGLLARYRGGLWVCDLSEARSLDGICHAVAAVLGLAPPQVTDADMAQHIALALAERGPTLLLLDNADRVVTCIDGLVGAILERAPGTALLLTTRRRPGLESEHTIELPALPLLRRAAGPSEAAQLFVDRARAIRLGYQPSEEDLAIIEAIVERLDGLPLAVELAAARMRVLGPRQLQLHLEERFNQLLDRRSPDSGRHRTMRAAIDLSWEQLSASEKSALAQLAVFRGGFSVEAATAVVVAGTQPGAPWFVDVLHGLCESSLVATVAAAVGEDELRYGIYETVREYIFEKEDLGSLIDAAKVRHLEYYRSVARQVVYGGHSPRGTQVKLLLSDVDNLIAAFGFADTENNIDAKLVIAAALQQPLLSRGPVSVLSDLLDGSIADAESAQTESRALAAALVSRSCVAIQMGNRSQGLGDAQRALAVAKRQRSRWLEGRALSCCGMLLSETNPTQAEEKLQEALGIQRELSDLDGQGLTLGVLGRIALERVRINDARQYYRRAIATVNGDLAPARDALLQLDLARLEQRAGCFVEARLRFRMAYETLKEMGDRRRQGDVEACLASVAIDLARHEDAEGHLEQALRIYRGRGDAEGEADALTLLGLACVAAGDPAEGLLHFDAVRFMLSRRPTSLAVIRSSLWAVCGLLLTGELEQAQLHRLRAQQMADEQGDSALQEFASAVGTYVDVCVALQGEDAHVSRSALEKAEELMRRADSCKLSSLDQRELWRLLRAAYRDLALKYDGAGDVADAALSVSLCGRSFDAGPKGMVNLATRGSLRLILKTLADMRQQSPDKALPLEALLEIGWPGERVMPSAGASRVYTAIGTLRRMGLKQALLRRDDGYLLDPSLSIHRHRHQ